MDNYKGGRILWLTDTFDDHNGVSMVLQAMHREVRERELPIDILVCSDTILPEPNLMVLKPVTKFSFPFYRNQPIRVPGFFDLRKIFLDGGYDRIVCSTEGPMGMAALYLRKWFGVKAYFYLHTDWLMFARKAMKISDPGIAGISRLLRLYYKGYDGLFVLNTEQQQWLTSEAMGLEATRVFLTAHWAEGIFNPVEVTKKEVFGLPEETPLILYTGRLSAEKGVMELPEIYRKVKQTLPDVKMVVAGTGPGEQALRDIFPEAVFTGWVDHNRLPAFYSAADLLVLPSRFDTFSCVVLEALSCGLPVIAYDTKGPRDIISHGVSGFLANDTHQMALHILEYFGDSRLQMKMKEAASERGKNYDAVTILDRLMADVGLLKAS
jgi:glycosyltransferase involved in cell wall biosynthesis